jgi:hypothetical protein
VEIRDCGIVVPHRKSFWKRDPDEQSMPEKAGPYYDYDVTQRIITGSSGESSRADVEWVQKIQVFWYIHVPSGYIQFSDTKPYYQIRSDHIFYANVDSTGIQC